MTIDGRIRTLIFDFGFSAFGAAYNAKALGEDISRVEVLALSHGYSDHLGGFEKLVEIVGRQGIELVLHPEVFKSRPEGRKAFIKRIEPVKYKGLKKDRVRGALCTVRKSRGKRAFHTVGDRSG